MSVVPTDASYSGVQPALLATGYFYAEEGLHDVSMSAVQEIFTYDVTNALQFTFDVKTFNEYLGVHKDSSVNIVYSAIDLSSLRFPNDTITITATDISNGLLDATQVMSVGSLSTIYQDFAAYVGNYFNDRNGFETIFDLSSQELIKSGAFDASALINIIHKIEYNPNTHEYIKDLSGSITLNNVNNMLNYACYNNIFGNRELLPGDQNKLSSFPIYAPYLDPTTQAEVYDLSSNPVYIDASNVPVYVVDPSGTPLTYVYHDGSPATPKQLIDDSGNLLFKYLYSVENGFLAEDLIFVSTGFKVKLNLDILNNQIDLNAVGFADISAYDAQTNYTRGYFSKMTLANNSNINTTIVVPLLIKLKNLTLA